MRVLLVLFALAVMLFGIVGWPLRPETATAASGQPFQELQGQIDALHAQVAALAEETPVPLRVFDGEGNDLGLYAGRDTDFNPDGPIHVFFEVPGVTASYSPSGILGVIDSTAFRYESDDCTGPVFYDVAGVAGRSREGTFLFTVAVAGTVTQEVLVGSRNVSAPRGSGFCESFSPPIPTSLVPVQFFDPADIDIPIQVAPVVHVAPAES
ncbi:MAG: hypothetical protein JRH19_26000 [Deltaproteobacteria bacterium]|nr:hypothetical protein [Deltaproteobacteria bacterium]